MTRGRPRKPLALHVADGTFVPCRHSNRSELTATGTPIKPKGLDRDAAWLWKLITDDMAGVVGRIDTPALSVLCRIWSCLRTVERAAATNPTDRAIRGALLGYSQFWHKLAADFGLTPASRAKLPSIGGTQADDTEARFFGDG